MRKFLKIGILVILVVLIISFGWNLYIKNSTMNQIVDNGYYSKLGNIDCIVVLGAGIWGDEPSPMLRDRLVTAIDLYKNGISKKIIMTGDHGKKCYDEVSVMKNFAVSMGVPEKDIFKDHAGFSSYDSIYRAREIFGAKNIVIVTQKYHLHRSLYIANKLGISAYGVASHSRSYPGDKLRELRETVARVKDAIKCIFKPKPKFLGKKIPLTESGNVT